MSKVRPESLSQFEKRGLLNELWSMVALLENRDEIENFFKTLLSESEAVMLARRIQIARRLLQRQGYEDIRREMKVSYVTITNVHRWLRGDTGGYEDMIPKLEKELVRQGRVKQKQVESGQYGSFAWLKKHYPLHFLLFNLADLADAPPRKQRRAPGGTKSRKK